MPLNDTTVKNQCTYFIILPVLTKICNELNIPIVPIPSNITDLLTIDNYYQDLGQISSLEYLHEIDKIDELQVSPESYLNRIKANIPLRSHQISTIKFGMKNHGRVFISNEKTWVKH